MQIYLGARANMLIAINYVIWGFQKCKLLINVCYFCLLVEIKRKPALSSLVGLCM